MTDDKTRALIAEAEIRLETGRPSSGRQLYVADDESLIRRLADALSALTVPDGDVRERLIELLDPLLDRAYGSGEDVQDEMIDALLAAFPVLSRGARIIREFRGDDVWRDDTGQIWVRQEQLVETVQTSRDITGATEVCGECGDKLDLVGAPDGQGSYMHCWRCWYREHPLELRERIAGEIEAEACDVPVLGEYKRGYQDGLARAAEIVRSGR